MRSSRLHGMNLGWTVIVLVVIAGCSDGTGSANVETATLGVTINSHPGNTDYEYEFATREGIAVATVRRRYNPPTGEEFLEGDLASIYEAVTGTPPESPTEYRTVDEILEVLAAEGWEIVDDAATGDELTSTHTITLQRPLSTQS